MIKAVVHGLFTTHCGFKLGVFNCFSKICEKPPPQPSPRNTGGGGMTGDAIEFEGHPSIARCISCPLGQRGMCLHLLLRMITAAHQRTRFDVADSFCFAAVFPIGKFIGVDPANDRKVLHGGAEVLAEGEDVAADGYQVVQHLVDF
jgi:hypothetical protein